MPARRVCQTILALLVALSPCVLSADDWPQWLGPHRDGVWREKKIVKKFATKELLPRVWSHPIRDGYAGPAVADGRVFVMDRVPEEGIERVLCLDANTGKEIWKREYPVKYTIDYPAGPRATPTVDGDRVYTIGAMGHMYCLDVKHGHELWKKDFHGEYLAKIPTWGMVAAPLVDGDRVITLVGGTRYGSQIVAFDRQTGAELGRALNHVEPGYCPPMMYTFQGTRQIVIWHPHAITGLDPVDLQPIWTVGPWKINAELTIATPRQRGNRLFVSSFYNGSRMLDMGLDGKSPTPVWEGKSNSEVRTDGLHCLMSTPWVTDTHIYGVCSYGQLRCLKADTGERVWETFAATGEGRWWNAFIIPHEDKFFLHNEQGDLIIAELSPKGYKEISRAKLVEPTREVIGRMTVWSHPAFAMQSVFARNDKEIVRVDLAEK
ncbi:MAG: PQQ-binding-like beta-propeller repeat protein [Planctomycetaceae bacterium]